MIILSSIMQYLHPTPPTIRTSSEPQWAIALSETKTENTHLILLQYGGRGFLPPTPPNKFTSPWIQCKAANLIYFQDD